MKQNNKVRLFVAVSLPEQVRTQIARIQKKLKESSLCDGRYTNASQAHLTLVFIGSIDEQAVNEIDTVLKTISFPVIKAQLGTIQSFKKHDQVNIIYLDISSHELATLVNLISELLEPWVAKETLLRSIELPPTLESYGRTGRRAQREFVSHVTIIRVKKVHDNEKLIALLQNITVEPHTFTIDSFILMESELSANGPKYTERARYQLLR